MLTLKRVWCTNAIGTCTVWMCLLLSPAAYPGETLFVSKLGDDSEGTSWATAFHTIQQALQAVPDKDGGHRILVRPDVYMEANLWPAQPGAPGAYNMLTGDFDGALGSGASGWVVIDSGEPDKGLKSYDWWGPIRAYAQGWSAEHTDPTFSAIVWDRWHLQHLYATGAEGGFFFDCTDRVEPFSVLVEDCVGIGRAFGGGVASCLSRPGEPIVFRRCNLWSLDFWGDTAGGYVRIHNAQMPERPDIVFDECSLVSPQCAFKAGNYGFDVCTYASLRRCLLVALNFSQPAGTPTDGIIQSVERGRHLKIDLDDCTLLGYKVFGVKVQRGTETEITYHAIGGTRAYVQYLQNVPDGILRLGHWPAELFAQIAPPAPGRTSPAPQSIDLVRKDRCEVSPVLWRGKPLLLEAIRPASGGTADQYHLLFTDPATDTATQPFAQGYSLACAHVHDDTCYVYASRFEEDHWNDVTVFWSKDLERWEHRVAIVQDPAEHLFNSSVCDGPDGLVMAYESNDPQYPAFTIKFARSADGTTWEQISGAVFGADRYAACPAIRYHEGSYYLLYLEHRRPRWFFETYIARSNDLLRWELSARNPVLTPAGLDDGINASDPDLIEIDGQTWLYYSVGDQRTWMNIKRAIYAEALDSFLIRWFQGAAPVPTR